MRLKNACGSDTESAARNAADAAANAAIGTHRYATLSLARGVVTRVTAAQALAGMVASIMICLGMIAAGTAPAHAAPVIFSGGISGSGSALAHGSLSLPAVLSLPATGQNAMPLFIGFGIGLLIIIVGIILLIAKRRKDKDDDDLNIDNLLDN